MRSIISGMQEAKRAWILNIFGKTCTKEVGYGVRGMVRPGIRSFFLEYLDIMNLFKSLMRKNKYQTLIYGYVDNVISKIAVICSTQQLELFLVTHVMYKPFRLKITTRKMLSGTRNNVCLARKIHTRESGSGNK